ncbi:hypothetical protein ABZ342_32025 [Amycolatopsis sp. NPDC005961]|uniref:hypothetical protein n=1 Tax=Amycolatopsis sp. NPDC005961 TaxID=3156720 RepID=UPI00340F3A46
MRIIIGLIVFITLWVLYLIGYRVTAPPDPAPLAPSTSTCPPPTTLAPTATATPSGGGAGMVAHPTRGWPCPAVTSTMTVTAVPADQ